MSAIDYELPENRGCPATWPRLRAAYDLALRGLVQEAKRTADLYEKDADAMAGVLRTLERAKSDIQDYNEGTVPV